MTRETINAVLADWNCAASKMVVWYWDPWTNKARETTVTDATGIHKRTNQVLTANAHAMNGELIVYFRTRADLINSFDPVI